MKRYAYLIMVDADGNNNKFYEMIENENGMIELYNGRVQSSRVKQNDKPSYEWNKILNSKLKKGYSDVTSFRSVSINSEEPNSEYKPISDLKINTLFTKLQQYANKSVTTNYSIKSADVTQQMVDGAQSIINDLTFLSKSNSDIFTINKKLETLYTIIPRKMNKVKDHLIQTNDLNDLNFLISKEQDILDSMAGQVSQNTASNIVTNISNNEKTILDILGLQIDFVSDEEMKMIKSRMFDYDGKTNRGQELINAYKVINNFTEERFKNHLNSSKNKSTMLMYHGSRNENWLYILQDGLKIRPSNAIYSGSMFDDGIYGADANGITTPLGKPNPGYAKSYGYTSSSRARYTSGNDNTVFMAIKEFHVGNQTHIYSHDSSCYNLSKQIKGSQYDSVYAHGINDGGKSGSLQNSEFIVYKPEQVTIRYLLELKN